MYYYIFLETPSLSLKSSSISGRPSRNFTFGSHPNNSFAFVISGFLCLGSSGVFSTIFISTFGLISCKHTNEYMWFKQSDFPAAEIQVVAKSKVHKEQLLENM